MHVHVDLSLQLVGQKLLYHASQQLPVLASLPDAVKDDVIEALYTRPFVQAIQMVRHYIPGNPNVEAP